ncbi:UDP-glucoronosyl and UDP-glucosyl transferase domain-containing protein [Ditylenchus destructor]|uniref:UDP-glucuronosyltransferase n=1 Tax=Ditylenchus destructor TaxID=166010 RepID=A0AAD4N7I0_9BILA|nr:UDP-glucoronosyl and UDP-glucosyl transferase domain-containing protein [Ditylenchus destructor]
MYVRSFLHVLLSLLVQVWLVSFSNSKEKLKILVSAPTLGWSHLQFQSRIADVLVEAGHEVHLLVFHMNPTVDCCAKLGSKAHEVIHVPRSVDRQQEMMKMQVIKNQFSGTSNMILDGSMREFAEMVTMCCQELINNTKVIAELQKEQYDVGISELYDLCMFGVFHHIGTKTTLATFAITLENLGASYFGLYSVSSYVTNLWTPSINGPNMNFLERAYNLFNDICLESYVQKMQFQLQKFSAIFDKAKDGVVLVSFGTFADSSRMPEDIRMAFINMFTAFPTYEFIWKFMPGSNDQILINNGSNMHLSDWVDQASILSHPKTRAFVTHCGWNSMNEAARAGIPTVGIPLLGDQMYNAAVMHHKRVGVYVDIQTVGPTSGGVIIDALRKVLYNEEYRTNVRLVQQKLRSEPFPAKERLVKWVEFAAQFPDLNELNLPTVDDLGILASYVNMIDFFNGWAKTAAYIDCADMYNVPHIVRR